MALGFNGLYRFARSPSAEACVEGDATGRTEYKNHQVHHACCRSMDAAQVSDAFANLCVRVPTPSCRDLEELVSMGARCAGGGQPVRQAQLETMSV
jgi:hypothetical protein